ncbi:hypothetical protein ZWY2020_034501 [Hordeum vulgare]|nr:hypothetical protein ZWY2020_034501 [Hordeum vulgare]
MDKIKQERDMLLEEREKLKQDKRHLEYTIAPSTAAPRPETQNPTKVGGERARTTREGKGDARTRVAEARRTNQGRRGRALVLSPPPTPSIRALPATARYSTLTEYLLQSAEEQNCSNQQQHNTVTWISGRGASAARAEEQQQLVLQ